MTRPSLSGRAEEGNKADALFQRRPRGASRQTGFTLPEMLIVVVILGVLAALIVPRLLVTSEDAKKNACAENVVNINIMVEKWYFEKGYWPANDLSDIEADPDYFPKGLPVCPVKPSKAYDLALGKHRVKGHAH